MCGFFSINIFFIILVFYVLDNKLCSSDLLDERGTDIFDVIERVVYKFDFIIKLIRFKWSEFDVYHDFIDIDFMTEICHGELS